jgi:sulfatase maturation enzyme AslB (radical SAM superfamily)
MYKAKEQIRVQWFWGNKCNFDCSYCPPALHNNKMEIPEHEVFLEAVEYLSRQIRFVDMIPCMEFTGGEPSQLPFLGTYLRASQGNMPPNSSLVTNGSASTDWFEQIIPFYTYIEISYHPGWSNFTHITNVIDFIKEQDDSTDVTVVVNVDNDDERWIKGVSAYNRFLQMGYKAKLKLLYSNFGKGNQLYPYKTYQLEQYYSTFGKEFNPEHTVFHQDGITERRQRHDLNKEKLENKSYNFKDKLCYAGVEHLVVLDNGDVYRGWCKVGGKLGNVFDKDVVIPTEPIKCPLDYCRNGFDKEATKIESA